MDLTAFINAYRGPLIGLIASWGAPGGTRSKSPKTAFPKPGYIVNRAAATGKIRKSLDAGCVASRSISTATGPGVVGVGEYASSRSTRRCWSRPPSRLIPKQPNIWKPCSKPSSVCPPKQRQVVLMHYLEETSVNEVATLLSVSAKTVEGRLYQARKTLRRLLENKPAARQIGRMLLCL